MRPVLLLEINEVPWRLLDHFMDHERLPNIRRFFSSAQCFTTRSTDEGELSPWITWPSFHRGVPNTQHGIQFLGQDPVSFKGTPIWDEYRARGHSIGLFGSLQSWPPKDPGPGGFYVPDTFATDERCIPAWVEPFQAFNLKQTASNGRVINSKSLYDFTNLKFALNLPRLGIRPRALAAVASQLALERIDTKLTARRPIFQGILAWEIFRKLFDPATPPAFSTFFTNQVAGIMHRYWDQVFPEDFSHSTDVGQRPHVDTMLFALESVDEMVADAMSFCETNPELIVVFAASMGQGPVVRSNHTGYELSIPRVGDLILACGLTPHDFEPLLAMVPQVCVQIPDRAKRSLVRETLESARSASDEKLFSIDERGDRLSITLGTPSRPDIEAGRFTLAGREHTWRQTGIQVNSVEAGTGYHIPEGSMAVYGKGLVASDLRKPMLATEAKDFILSISGVR